MSRKHFCFSCASWKTCSDVRAGGSHLCEKFKNRSLGEILKSCGKGRIPAGFMERVYEAHFSLNNKEENRK